MSKKAKITEQMKTLQEFADNSESDEEAIGQIVNVNFEGFTPQEDDFHGIQRLLAQTFRGLDVNISDVADLIIQQNFVGCVIKEVIDDDKEAMEVDDDALEGEPDTESDYVFGVNTILNISHKKKLEIECIKSLRKGLLKRCQESKCSDDLKQQFSSLLESSSQHVGFLINERLVNLPADIALPAFHTLLKEMEESNDIGMPFKFSHIILIAKTHKVQTLKTKKKLRKLKSDGDPSASADLEQDRKEFYDNSEEQSFAEVASLSFEYGVADCSSLLAESWNEQEADKDARQPFRKVLVVPTAKVAEALKKAESQLNEG